MATPMTQTIEAIYENGVFRPLEPVTLPEGEHVQITVPEITAEVQQRLEALETFEAEFEDLTEEQWKLFDEAVEKRPFFGDRELKL